MNGLGWTVPGLLLAAIATGNRCAAVIGLMACAQAISHWRVKAAIRDHRRLIEALPVNLSGGDPRMRLAE